MESTVYFFFGANNTDGSGDDGASATFSIREAGAAAGAAAVLTGTPTLLTHGDFTPGAYEIAVPATTGNGFTADKTYAVFATLLVSAQNPTGHVGIFRTGAVPSSVQDMGANVLTATAIQDAAITNAKFATDAIDANALAADAVTEIQAGLSTFDATTDKVDLLATGLNLIDVSGFAMPLAIEIIAAGVAGKVSGVTTGVETFVGMDGATNKFISTVDGDGNRTGVTYP